MNKKRIEEILELMEKYGLTEIDVEEEGVKVHLKKGTAQAAPQVFTQPVMQSMHVPSAEAPAAKTEQKKNLTDIKAPMVGTFYRAPSPDAKPYVEKGDSVKEGDILCIIEAMKLMNEIKCEVSGRIAEVLVENGHPIEFGQVLFRVEPS